MLELSVSCLLDSLLPRLPDFGALWQCGLMGPIAISAPNLAVLAGLAQPNTAAYNIAPIAQGLVVPSADCTPQGAVSAL